MTLEEFAAQLEAEPGVPLEPEPWQRDLLAVIYGTEPRPTPAEASRDLYVARLLRAMQPARRPRVFMISTAGEGSARITGGPQ